jgi:hypothetical protein
LDVTIPRVNNKIHQRLKVNQINKLSWEHKERTNDNTTTAAASNQNKEMNRKKCELNLPKRASRDLKFATGLSPTRTEKAETLSAAVPDL